MVKTLDEIATIITRYIDSLQRDIAVDKVILIGPYARGTAEKWSDIEVIVISDSFANMSHIDRLDILTGKTIGIDTFLVPYGGYTPDEYEHPEKTLHMRWIKSTGRVIYSAD